MLQVVPEGLEIMKHLGVQHRHQKYLLPISYLTGDSSNSFLYPRKNTEGEKMLTVQKLLFTMGK